jgi:hypothetical protein
MPSEGIHVMERSNKFHKITGGMKKLLRYGTYVNLWRLLRLEAKTLSRKHTAVLKHFTNQSLKCFSPGGDRTHYFHASSSIVPMNNFSKSFVCWLVPCLIWVYYIVPPYFCFYVILFLLLPTCCWHSKLLKKAWTELHYSFLWRWEMYTLYAFSFCPLKSVK